MLFDKIVFGPIRSRRFGASLGVNLIPVTRKICSFDCVYCECGWTDEPDSKIFPSRTVVYRALQQRLEELRERGELPDSITFSGNGEPTLYPDFGGIIDDTIDLRDHISPHSVVTVLSNATMLDREPVFNALLKVDNNVMKLDAGTEDTYRKINRCYDQAVTLEHITRSLCRFDGDLIVQTLFLRGSYNGARMDNTAEKEVAAWLERIRRINPRKVLLYPIDRATPAREMEYVSPSELKIIAGEVEKLGIEAAVYD